MYAQDFRPDVFRDTYGAIDPPSFPRTPSPHSDRLVGEQDRDHRQAGQPKDEADVGTSFQTDRQLVLSRQADRQVGSNRTDQEQDCGQGGILVDVARSDPGFEEFHQADQRGAHADHRAHVRQDVAR